jgi:hypothetical protein
MQHVDEELLTLLALQAEQPDAETEAHLRGCEQCRADLSALRRVVAAGTDAPRDEELLTPPPRVWDGITAALAVAPPTQAERSRTEGARVTPMRPSPGRRALPTWLAVAASFVVGAIAAGSLVALVVDGDEADRPAGQTVAEAELDPLDETGTAGSAAVIEVSGERLLDVRVDDRTPGAGYREVWLLDADAGRLVSLGVLTGTHSRLVIPDGLDLADYPVVDVSREPLDGDPAHSSDSIARGELSL